MHQPQSAADYIKTNLEVFAKDIHPTDQIELHKQIGEMLYSTLTNSAMETSRSQASVINIQYQFKLEKVPFIAKDTKIIPIKS